MAKEYRKAASKRRRRRHYKRHDGVPQLAARICGCSLSMAYKVRAGEATSARVSQALLEAAAQLLGSKEQAA